MRRNTPKSSPPATPADDAAPTRRRFRPGFLSTITIVGIVSIGALAFALSGVIGSQIRGDQLKNTRANAQLLAQSAIAPVLLPQLGRPHVDYRPLDAIVVAAKPSTDFDTVVVLSTRGRVLYANDHRLIGRTGPLSPVAAQAFGGTTALSIQQKPQGAYDLSSGAQIAVAVPLAAAGGKRTAAVVEVHVPYGPVASVISSRTRNLKLALFGAAFLLFAALWPRLLAASRALKRQVDPAQQALIKELRKGLDNDELVVHFQPKISLREGRVTGMEALVRWNHPKRGLLGPDKFVPAAMAGGLTGPLTIHVANLSLRACRAWHTQGVDAGVNINLAAANVLDERLPSELARLLDQWSLPARTLGVEITETAIAADPTGAGAVLEALDNMGLRIAIDDFGTGYSSLAGLRTLPVDELKVDRSFVSGLTTDQSDAAIVRSIIGLAHELGIEVIAEGVEDESTVRHLTSLGCDQAQGYYFARPMDLPALLTWLAAPQLGAKPAVAAAQVD